MQYKRVMAIDYGDVRIGIAISDMLKIISSPYETYKRINIQKDLEHISQIIKDKEVETVVIGLPLNMDGSEGNRAEVTREFGNLLLENNENIKIVYQDERLSSVEAEDILLEANVRRDKRKQLIDQIAAQIILQSYLDSVKK